MRPVRAGLGVVLMVVGLGCGDATAPGTGSIAVTVTSQGATADLDPDGYNLRVDGGPAQPTATSGAFTLAALPPGMHLVELGGLASNCTVKEPNPRTVDVRVGWTASAPFSVVCSPPTGRLLVTTATSGGNFDPSLFITVGQPGALSVGSTQLGANGTAALALPPGAFLIRLYDVAANCDVVLPRSPEVVIVVGTTTALNLDIRCDARRQLAFERGEHDFADIWVVNSDGTDERRVVSEPRGDVDPAWSPDGARIAFASGRDMNKEIYVASAEGAGAVRLTTEPAPDYSPAWSPDGKKIVFVSERDRNGEIYVMNGDGTNQVRLTNGDGNNTDPAWSPDGTRIAFRKDRGTGTGLWTIEVDGSRLVQITSGLDGQPAWSPDASRIAFSRTMSPSRNVICIVNGDGSGLTQLTRGYDENPAWSPNGRKIAYTSGPDYYGGNVNVISVDGIPAEGTVTSGRNPVWRP